VLGSLCPLVLVVHGCSVLIQRHGAGCRSQAKYAEND
jgi:hypothetical protein